MHDEYWMPIVLFHRRTLFTFATIYLFNYPNVQMIVNMLLTMLVSFYLAADMRRFTQKSLALLEVGSEILFLSACLFLQ